MQTHRYSLCAALIVAVSSPAAFAEDFYVEGGVAVLQTDESYPKSDWVFESLYVRGGYQVNDFLSLEAELTKGFGSEAYTEQTRALGPPDNTYSVDVDLEGMAGAFAKVDLPMTERFSPFFRVGYVTADIDYDAEIGGGDYTQNDNGVAIGIGSTFDLYDNLYVRGDYTRIEAGDIEANHASLGLGLRF